MITRGIEEIRMKSDRRNQASRFFRNFPGFDRLQFHPPIESHFTEEFETPVYRSQKRERSFDDGFESNSNV